MAVRVTENTSGVNKDQYSTSLEKKQVKVCRTCGETKSSSDFYEVIDGHHIRRSQCSSCRDKLEKHLVLFVKKKESKRKRLQNIFTRKGKVCFRCGKYKSLSEYYRCNQRLDGLKGECRECSRHYTKQWMLNHPDYASKQKKEWRKANPDRARQIDTRAKAKHRKRHPDREYARQTVMLAREHGLVLSLCSWPDCSATEKIEAAHDNYSKPHLIHGLCHKHHNMWDYCKGELPFDLPLIDISPYLKPSVRGRQRKDVPQLVGVGT